MLKSWLPEYLSRVLLISNCPSKIQITKYRVNVRYLVKVIIEVKKVLPSFSAVLLNVRVDERNSKIPKKFFFSLLINLFYKLIDYLLKEYFFRKSYLH